MKTGEPRRLRDELSQYDRFVTFNGTAFDLPAVTTVSARTSEAVGEAVKNTARSALLSALTPNTPKTRVPLAAPFLAASPEEAMRGDPGDAPRDRDLILRVEGMMQKVKPCESVAVK